MKYGDLTWKQGAINPSGIKPLAYYIAKEDLLAFPKIDHETAATIAEAVTYNGDFVLMPYAFWRTIYTTQGKGKVSYEALGEKDCKMFTNKANLSYPDINDEAKAFAKAGVNSSYIIIVPLPMNRFVVIGGEDYDVEINTTGDSGDAAGSAKGTTIEVTAPDVVPLPNYKGILHFDGFNIDCETGEKTMIATMP